MKKYISIIRGINVSGQKKIKMAELKSLYEELNFKHVVTYIQSGNVLFCSPINDQDKIKTMIQDIIYDHYGFDVTVIILTEKRLRKILSEIPFDSKKIDLTKFYFCFLEKDPSPESVEELLQISDKNEKFIILGKVIYVYCPLGFGRARFHNNFFEKKLKINATSRNWKTTNKLLDLVSTMKCK
jgi:uncharacterized protein (DUF1697 family)